MWVASGAHGAHVLLIENTVGELYIPALDVKGRSLCLRCLRETLYCYNVSELNAPKPPMPKEKAERE